MSVAEKLKGTTIKYKDSAYFIQDCYVVDARFICETNKGTLKIDKSEMKRILKEKSPVKGNISGSPIKTEDKPCDKYYVTKQYDKFIYNQKNRSVNDAHVTALIRSIKKNDLLFAQPILVNDKYEVIDGQHRLRAAMKLSRPIYYIIKKGLTIDDAIALNINTKNWGYKDYLDHWIAKGKEQYIYFREFLDKYKMPYTMSAGLLMKGKTVTGGGNFTDEFKSGKLHLEHQEFAEKTGKLVQDLSEYGDFTTDRSFIIALVEGMEFAELSPEFIIKKVSMAPDKFTKCSDSESYLRMLEDVINYHSRTRIRLF
ncbi:ParB/Srx family N-terminal domain-containing protein [Gracilimonas tropica]|uniref:ParB/Srx family N-terminal domain-containing protein n=1 Tax=Gracilimonas tropica TaxID=454600 RepID=UPI0003649D89|nr:ParB/Srx family N-terminal domain-containing protein [Gracilimonas tropica]